jgi:hypothetical protein
VMNQDATILSTRILRFSNFAVQGSCSGASQKTLTAEFAEKGRRVRGEIQIKPLR